MNAGSKGLFISLTCLLLNTCFSSPFNHYNNSDETSMVAKENDSTCSYFHKNDSTINGFNEVVSELLTIEISTFYWYLSSLFSLSTLNILNIGFIFGLIVREVLSILAEDEIRRYGIFIGIFMAYWNDITCVHEYATYETEKFLRKSQKKPSRFYSIVTQASR